MIALASAIRFGEDLCKGKRVGLVMAAVAAELLGSLAGCSPSHRRWAIPNAQYFVGGGWEIDYTTPVTGTVYLVEQNSRTLLLTKSLQAGEHLAYDAPAMESLVKRAGHPSGQPMPALYFVPNEPTAKTPADK
jgi:hypothetical protein